jgi:hypothetical protein
MRAPLPALKSLEIIILAITFRESVIMNFDRPDFFWIAPASDFVDFHIFHAGKRSSPYKTGSNAPRGMYLKRNILNIYFFILL